MSEIRLVPRGIRNNNPGNLIYVPNINWRGEIGVDGRLLIFDTMLNGVRACVKDLLAGFKEVNRTAGKSGEDTIREIITEFAPPHENDTEAYIAAVSQRSGFGPDLVLTPDQETLFKLATAIFHHENGGDFVSDADIAAGVVAALEGA